MARRENKIREPIVEAAPNENASELVGKAAGTEVGAVVNEPAANARLDVLIQAYTSMTGSITFWLGRTEQILGLSLTITGAAIAYGVKERVQEVFLFVPFALVTVTCPQTLVHS